MDAHIESCTKACELCQLVQRNPTNAPVHPYIPSSRPGERVHIDYAGPVEGKMLLIVVGSYSKWPEVVVQNSTTSEATVNALRTIFSRGGIPHNLVSTMVHSLSLVSSRTSWTGWECCTNLHRHIIHPSSNGQAE